MGADCTVSCPTAPPCNKAMEDEVGADLEPLLGQLRHEGTVLLQQLAHGGGVFLVGHGAGSWKMPVGSPGQPEAQGSAAQHQPPAVPLGIAQGAQPSIAPQGSLKQRQT